LKGLFRLGNLALGKIYPSAHPAYTQILALHIITLYIAEIKYKFLYIRKVYLMNNIRNWN